MSAEAPFPSQLSPAHEKSSIVVGDADGYIWVCEGFEEKKDLKNPSWFASLLRNDHRPWKKFDKSPTIAGCHSACASSGGFILSARRRDTFDTTQLRDCFSYDVNTKQWTTLPQMLTIRMQHSSIYNNGHYYVAGGRNEKLSFLDTMDTLDMGSLQWSSLPPFPSAHVGPCSPNLVFVSNTLFLIGGLALDLVKRVNFLSVAIHEYSSSEKAWRTRAPMPRGCLGGCVVCFNGDIFVVGGEDRADNRSTMRYNVQSDTWLLLKPPRFRHFCSEALVWKNKILLFGGSKDGMIEEYCPLTDQWSTWTLKLPTKKTLCCVARV